VDEAAGDEVAPGGGEPARFGALLRRHRLAAGLTQEALAERAGLSARGLQDLEKGARRPLAATVRRLAGALSLSPEEGAAFAAAAPRATRRPRGGEDGSSPATAVPGSLRPPALPAPLTSFVGREREVAGVRRLLAASRLVTLTGVGGIGKTRLALAVARDVLEGAPEPAAQPAPEGRGALFVDLVHSQAARS
jgi:transcriptional regulator with XRE-family HTH domain